jgi:hypothetical protein
VQYWAKAEERLIRELSITKTLRTPVNFIVHTLQEVNDGLAHGRYFFMDVAKAAASAAGRQEARFSCSSMALMGPVGRCRAQLGPEPLFTHACVSQTLSSRAI